MAYQEYDVPVGHLYIRIQSELFSDSSRAISNSTAEEFRGKLTNYLRIVELAAKDIDV